jgi:hypothetical protein
VWRMQAALSSQLEMSQWGTSHTLSAVEALSASVSTAATRAAHEAATHIVKALLPSAGAGGSSGDDACEAAVAAILDAVKTAMAAFTVSGGNAGCCSSPCAPASACGT